MGASHRVQFGPAPGRYWDSPALHNATGGKPMTPESIRAIVEQQRLLHPELGPTLTWNGVKRILAREAIELIIARTPDSEAKVGNVLGQWMIFLDSASPRRRRLHNVIHELAHIWLHHDPFHARSESVYKRKRQYEGEDPREADAELFALYVLGERKFERTL